MDNKPAYKSVEDRDISTVENLYELVDLPATDETYSDVRVTETSETELKNTNSRKAGLVIGIALSTAVLALVVAVVFFGLSTAVNSNSEIQSLTADVRSIQLSLNQSVNALDILGHQISALQADTATQCGILNQSVSSLKDTVRQHSDYINNTVNSKGGITADVRSIQLSLNQSVNALDILGHQISALQTDTVTQYGILNQAVNSLQDSILEHADFLNKVDFKGSITNPATSCSEIATHRPSGEYWILRNTSSVQVYCDTNRTCCNATGGWMRVVNLDMTDSNQQCPDGFLLQNRTTAPLRTCGRPGPRGCMSTTFPVHGIEYSRVCGRVIGYQFGGGYAFYYYYNIRGRTIDDHFVDGFILTHGQLPRKHIWTFTVALDEVDTRKQFTCPCTQSDIPYTGVVPPFIGQDYFCDTASRNSYQFILYPDDPLWNGQGCGGTSNCCSFNNPPWFCKQLSQPTTDGIELRGCFTDTTSNEDIFIELVDIFVQ